MFKNNNILNLDFLIPTHYVVIGVCKFNNIRMKNSFIQRLNTPYYLSKHNKSIYKIRFKKQFTTLAETNRLKQFLESRDANFYIAGVYAENWAFGNIIKVEHVFDGNTWY